MELDEISEQLNIAIEDGDFEKAVDLANEYRSRFDEIWAEMPGAARRTSDLPERAMILHRQAVGRLVALRAAKAAELHSVKQARPYGRRQNAPEAWQVTL